MMLYKLASAPAAAITKAHFVQIGTMMVKTIFSMILTTWLMLVSASVASAEFSDTQKQELNKLFETYIKENPLVVRDALIALANKEEQDRRAEGISLVKIDEGDPTMGASADEADITIYEFSDYNCGYCKRVFTQIQQVLADDPKVRLTVKEFPILAESSETAARAAIAAQMQGLFGPFHIGMMEWNGPISFDSIIDVAEGSGLNVARLQKDMASEEVSNIIARTRATAQALEVSGTPALIIGSEFIPGAIGADQIKQIIEAQRAAGNS